LVCLILVIALAIGGLRPGIDAFRQALGVRGLLQSGAGISSEEPNNPFVCLRTPGNLTLAQVALPSLSDTYLQGVGLCLAGEDQAGMTTLKAAKQHSNANVQYAAGLSVIDAQAGAEALSGSGLSGEELAAVLLKLANRPDVDPYHVLRMLAQQANTQPDTWTAWLQGSARMEVDKEWQAALDWINEGLAIAPPTVRGSLLMHAGWINQVRSDIPDYQSALAFYNQAIAEGGWIYPSDQAYTHIHRGEIYQNLKEEYSSAQVIEEFNRASMLSPKDYWVMLTIGNEYLYYLNDFDQAETYYRQAMAVNDKYPYAYLSIGEVYLERGDKAAAADWYQQALDHEPNWQPALDRLQALEGK
jgi:tetratricopeptide (TPR) repeat protein